ncbi:hypothetical protein CEXT_530251 [Caerostris extrusa]|uniref:Uncharacterized protein n=1 Tax=Caerostris extrusa TaxID=172846 RepID=A0AAV4NWA2_CAEEX|nr:hypothetical protein CEXT_530251 [Caerostris extrusa]
MKKKTASDSVGWAADYCTVRELLPAPSPTWAGALRLRRPGGSGLPDPTISTPCLARTPDQHREAEDRTPNLTPSGSLALRAAGLQDQATDPRRSSVFL